MGQVEVRREERHRIGLKKKNSDRFPYNQKTLKNIEVKNRFNNVSR